jgi:uncharacterized cupin superfamily protein
MKPIVNVDEVTEFNEINRGRFSARIAPLSSLVGARRLGYNVTIVPPGKTAFPCHNHRVNEEMFFVLEGSGILRFGNQEYPLKAHDLIACPPGGPEVAHQMINTGKLDLKYLALSTKEEVEICEYPDSKKIMSVVGNFPEFRLRHMSKADVQVDYFDGEDV